MSDSGGGRRGVLGAMLLVFALVYALHMGFASAHRFPVPAVQDEFAYLLSADTFAHGRLANPTHPMWEHFETFHVFHHPTYQAKYPPGQGLSLALGQVLGHPAHGVWLALALAAAATCWALAAVLPLRWAVLAPLLFVANYPVQQGWGQTYWGGGVAMLGGALFFGALVRLRSGLRARDAWLLGAGFAVLANSRPFEGLLAALLCAPYLAGVWRRARATAPPGRAARDLGLPLAASFLAVALWTLYYDWRLTGNPFALPYWNWNAEDSARADVRAYQGSDPLGLLERLRRLQVFFVGSVLALSAPFVLLRWRDPLVRRALLVTGVVTAVSVLATRAWPHYLAPLVAPILFLVVTGMRSLAGLRVAGRPAGRWAAGALVAVHLVLSGYRVAAVPLRSPSSSWHLRRQAIVDRLEAEPGRDLVLVSYPPDHSLHEEWIYNAADVDAAEVVWARDLGPARNSALLDHFRGRRVWRLDLVSGPDVAPL